MFLGRLVVGGLLIGALALPALAFAQIEVRHVAEHGELLDPAAKFWDTAPEATVPMLPQVVTTPRHPKIAVNALKVRAVHNGHWLAFRIEWKDTTQSDRIVVDQFGDQVAVEMPIKFNKDALPSPMMGNAGGRVDIWQWRAAFQRDLEKDDHTVHDLYPNAHADLYPDQVLRVTDAKRWWDGMPVNPYPFLFESGAVAGAFTTRSP